MTTTVFASRLGRLPIVAPDGGAVGVVADVVVGPPADDEPPPVYGLVATVPGRRIFVGIGRIAHIDGDGVHLRSGALNLRRFSRRPTERLAIAELLDRELDEHGEWVNDLGIGPSPRRATAWQVTTVDLVTTPPGRLGRRRGRHRSAGPDVLRPLLGDRDHHHQFRDLHPADAAERVITLTAQQRVAVARALDDEQLADLVEELPHDAQARLLTDLGIERGTDVLEAMEPDDAADVLGDLTPDGRARLLAAMGDDDAAVIRRLLAYDRDTTGGLMNPEPIVCTPDTTVAEALARLRDPDVVPAMAAQVFVVEPPAQTPTGAYLGTCGVQRLLREPPGRRLRGCVDPAPLALDPSTPRLEATMSRSAIDLATPRGQSRLSIHYDPDRFGRFSEAIARFLGTATYLVGQTIVVIMWIAINVTAARLRWDPYPFILLNLVFSTQASYAAPLILLAQNRQAERDRADAERDREVNARTLADTEYVARELAAIRLAVTELSAATASQSRETPGQRP